MLGWILAGVVAAVGLGFLIYWLLVITEGVFLGRRIVVWLYDITAHNYDSIKEFDDDAEQIFLAQPLIAQLGEAPAPMVLDVATGTGRLPYYLLNEPTFNGRTIGLDASREMLALARTKLAPFRHRNRLIQQAADALPFADESMDLVTCLESLEFFPSDTAAVREMVRVLKTGGMLMVTRRKGWEARTFLGRYRSRDEFEDWLKAFGLTEVFTQPWQIDYDQVYGRKAVTRNRSFGRCSL